MRIAKGDYFKIVSLKHDRKLHRAWERNRVFSCKENIVIGGNFQTTVEEANGYRWKTEEPALFYFSPHNSFNVIILFSKDDYYFYCNISSPYKLSDRELTYIDYDIDLIVQSDYTYKVVDEDEFAINKNKYNYPAQVIDQVNRAKKDLISCIDKREGPFSQSFISAWKPILFKYVSELLKE